MALIYIPSRIREDAKSYQILKTIQGFQDDFEKLSLEDALKLFEVRFPYRYKRISNFRLVAKLERSHDLDVIYLLAILKRGSNEWVQFNNEYPRYGQQHLEPLVDHASLDEYVNKKLQEMSEKDKPQPKDDLPDELHRWWWPFEYLHIDSLIMESDEWVRTFEVKHYADFWQSYYELVNAIVIGNLRSTAMPIAENSLIRRVDDGKNHFLYFSEFGALNPESEFVTITYIINALDTKISRTSQEDFERELRRKFSWVDHSRGNLQEQNQEIISDIDEISRYASRGYPAYVLEETNIWKEIQQHTVANLALSAEEASLLEKLRHGKSDVLPVFINGRAGSGKSTILYYLFSDYLFRKIKDDLAGEVLFLTYSEALLKNAVTVVRKLLDARSDLVLEKATSSSLTDVSETNWEACFQPFAKFLLEISQQHAVDEYTQDKFIDYKLFNQLLLGSNLPPHLDNLKLRLPRKISPDICWHVIRTFIKGYHSEDYLSPDDYEEIPNKEKSVSKSDYEEIYETVWEKWYKPLHEDHGYWDSQDLVRRIISDEWAEPKYAVVFCDEAQDFTRVEIELILSLLVYREYDLGWDKKVRLPFALAGDPFQTLNPTGFRWEAIKASFYDEITENLDPYNRGTIDMHYEELFFNYRSEAPIVRFSNLIQLWRKILFNNPEVEPQKPWREDQYIIPPRLFILGETITETEFFDLLKNSVVIVPCEQSGEEEFIEKEPLLSQAKKDRFLFSVQSPILAKGQEFPQVILYGFGEHCPDHFFDTENGQSRLTNEYWLNKLYVGATRAAKSLIIVDTKKGKEKLWQFALNNETIDFFLNRISNIEKWRTMVDGVTPGNYIGTEIDRQDPEESAKNLRKAGQENNSSALLRQAMDFYRRAGKDSLAKTCLAEANELDKQYIEAGKIFESIGQIRDAERCYWKDQAWLELVRLHAIHPATDELHRLISLMMVDQANYQPAVTLSGFLLAAFKDGRKLVLSEDQIQIAVKTMISRLLENPTPEDTIPWIAVADLFENLKPLFKVVDLEKLGQIYYNAGYFRRAVNIWELGNKTEIKHYYLAKAQSNTSTQDKIYWFDKAGEYELVIKEFESTQVQELSEREKRSVAQSYIKNNQLEKAIDVYWRLNDFDTAVKLLKEAVKKSKGIKFSHNEIKSKFKQLVASKNLDLAFNLLKGVSSSISRKFALELAGVYLDGLMKMEKWEEAISFTLLEKTKIRDVKRNTFPKLNNLSLDELISLNSLIVKEFAYNPPEATVKEKQVYTTYFLEIAGIGYKNWKEYFAVSELSTAIERSGRYIDILPYYEKLEAQNLTDLESQFIHARWLKTKSKQIERSRAEEINKKMEDRYEKEYKERLVSYHIEPRYVASLSEFPIPDETVSTPIQNIQVNWLRPRCRIVNPQGGDITLDVKTGIIMPFGVDFVEKNQNSVIKFFVKGWTLEGELIPNQMLVFKLGSRSYEFHI